MSRTRSTHLIPLLLALGAIPACAAVRPARFADAPAIEEVADDAPIALPRRREPLSEVVLSEAYLRRPLVDALDPARIPDAGDVNALDEVPRSTWFSPSASAAVEGPPQLPLRVLADAPATSPSALPVLDARGRRFELLRDPADRPQMRTAASVVASRLVRALGYFVAESSVIDLSDADLVAKDAAASDRARAFLEAGPPAVEGRRRAAATRWPPGVDLGPTPSAEQRGDDPNDRVAHPDRRTLRALKAVFAWLGVTRVTPGVLRDVYAGPSGRGHVVHYLASLDGALGADAVVRPTDDAEAPDQSAWITLGSLGLIAPRLKPTQTRWRSIGEYEPRVTWRDFTTSPPLEPLDRTLSADAYWAAKRIAGVQPAQIAAALDAAKLGDASARARLSEVLLARQRRVIAWGFAAVTPCELVRLDRAERGGESLVLRDEAASRGIVPAAGNRYLVSFVDARGRRIAQTALALGQNAEISILLPKGGWEYLVARVRVERAGKEAPRAFEAHLVKKGGAARVVGIRR